MTDLVHPSKRPRISKRLFRIIAWSLIGVIGLLLVLFPTLLDMPRRARVAQVKVEIAVLESAIAAFKSEYGVDPPSGITLHPTAEGWAADRTSRDKIRQLWPQFDFATCGGMVNVPPAGIRLNGAECLVFFLGGIINPVIGQPAGFSRNPKLPFGPGRPRDWPFFEFLGSFPQTSKQRTSRFIDLNGNGFPEYLDPLPAQTKPLLYISSNGGQVYDAADFDGAMRDVYRQGSAPDATPWKPKNFQIISPGQDGQYGVGGQYQVDKAKDLLSGTERRVECDNITNFVGGVLVTLPSTTTPSVTGYAPILGIMVLAGLACGILWFSIRRRA